MAFPAWTALGAAGLPAGAHGVTATPVRVVSGSHGFLLMGSDGGPGAKLFSSADGRMWTYAPTPYDRSLRDLASNGRDVFVLEAQGDAESRIWLYRGGLTKPVTLRSELKPDTDFWYRNWAITGSPKGIVVGHISRDLTEIELWSSANGVAFERTALRLDPGKTGNTGEAGQAGQGGQPPYNSMPLRRVVTKHGEVLAWTLHGQLKLVPANGFPVGALDRLPPGANVYEVIADGKRWSIYGMLLEPLRPGDQGDGEGDATAQHDLLRPGQWCGDGKDGVATARVDPGRSPDAGVSDTYTAASFTSYHDGFLMVGSSTDQNGRRVAGVWLSDDGCLWRKDRVSANRFDDADQIVSAAGGGAVTVLAGVRGKEGAAEPRMWTGS